MRELLPSLDLIKGFEAAARHLSFTRAADELCVTQSAISRQVKTLEEQLGVELFQRRHRALLLTPAGQDLYRAATEALQQLSNTANRIRARNSNRILTVSTTVGFASLWLIPQLSNFRDQHPDIDIRIDANNKMVDLARDGIEVAIRYCAPKLAPQGAIKLFGEEVLPVCSPRLLNGSLPLATPDDLRHHVLLHFENPFGNTPWLDWTVWLEAMQIRNLQPAGSLRFSQYDQMILAAMAGQGIALGRNPLVRQLIKAGKLAAPFALKSASTPRAYFLVVAADAATRADVKLFVAWLNRRAKEEVDRLSAPAAGQADGEIRRKRKAAVQ